MPNRTKRSSGDSNQHQKDVRAEPVFRRATIPPLREPHCTPDKHDWDFLDNFPDHEIYECRCCKLKKIVDLKTGGAVFGHWMF